LRGSTFKRKRKDGSISYGVIYDDHPEPGKKRKQIRIRGFNTRKDADDKLTEIRAAFQKTGKYYSPTRLTVTEYVEKWLAQISHSVRERTVTGYRERLRDYVLPTLGKLPMWAVEPQHMNDLYSALLRDGRKRKGKGNDCLGLRPRSVLHVHRITHAMFAEAVRSAVIAVNPCSNVRPPRVARTEQRVLTEAEVQRLLAEAKDDKLFPLLTTAIATGARMGELVALNWNRVDIDKGTIRIAYGQAKDRSLTEPKTSRSRRTIKLPPFALSALKAHKAKQKLASESPWSDETFVFQDEFDRPIRVADISGDFRPIAKRAGLGEDVHPHTLRHTYASLALKAGVPITTVSANLGHNNTTTTMGVYAHHIPAAEDAAAIAIQRAIGGEK